MYFMSPYRLIGHEMPEILGILTLLIALFTKPSISVSNKYLVYMLYMWIIPPICAMITGIPGDYSLSLLPVALILMSCYLCILLPSVDKTLVLRYYRILVYVAIGFFVIQEVSSLLFGYRPTLYLPFFEMYYSDLDMASFSESRTSMARSSSFFLEPSHFAQYILPYFCVVFSKYCKDKNNLLELIFFSLVLFFLKAGVGYITLIVVFFYYILKSDSLKLYQRVFIVFIGVSGVLVATIVFSNTEFMSSILGRMDEFSIEVDPYGSQSGFIRIWRGYFIYGAMDTLNQIFGVSVAGVDYVSNAVYIPGSRFEGSFSNGIQGLLIMGGVVGLVLFLRYIISLCKKLDFTGRLIIIAMMTLFFIEHMLNTPKMFLYILLASCFTAPIKQLRNNI